GSCDSGLLVPSSLIANYRKILSKHGIQVMLADVIPVIWVHSFSQLGNPTLEFVHLSKSVVGRKISPYIVATIKSQLPLLALDILVNVNPLHSPFQGLVRSP